MWRSCVLQQITRNNVCKPLHMVSAFFTDVPSSDIDALEIRTRHNGFIGDELPDMQTDCKALRSGTSQNVTASNGKGGGLITSKRPKNDPICAGDETCDSRGVIHLLEPESPERSSFVQ